MYVGYTVSGRKLLYGVCFKCYIQPDIKLIVHGMASFTIWVTGVDMDECCNTGNCIRNPNFFLGPAEAPVVHRCECLPPVVSVHPGIQPPEGNTPGGA